MCADQAKEPLMRGLVPDERGERDVKVARRGVDGVELVVVTVVVGEHREPVPEAENVAVAPRHVEAIPRVLDVEMEGEADGAAVALCERRPLPEGETDIRLI